MRPQARPWGMLLDVILWCIILVFVEHSARLLVGHGRPASNVTTWMLAGLCVGGMVFVLRETGALYARGAAASARDDSLKVGVLMRIFLSLIVLLMGTWTAIAVWVGVPLTGKEYQLPWLLGFNSQLISVLAYAAAAYALFAFSRTRAACDGGGVFGD